MTASVTSVTPYSVGTSPFPLSLIHVLSPQVIQPPFGAPYGPGSTQFDAYVLSTGQPVPEPAWATAVILAIAGLVLPARAALRRRRR
jgi:hypothetical protein